MEVSHPSHIPIKINPYDMPKFKQMLADNGYKWTIFQIVKPQQLFGMIKKIEYQGKNIEHHVRGYKDGTIETEFELCRISNIFNHLTTRSYSAHHKLTKMIKFININYEINENMMKQYDENAVDGFPRDLMEFPRWLFIGVLFWTPLGVLWRIGYELIKLLKSKNVKPTNAKNIILGD